MGYLRRQIKHQQSGQLLQELDIQGFTSTISGNFKVT